MTVGALLALLFPVRSRADTIRSLVPFAAGGQTDDRA